MFILKSMRAYEGMKQAKGWKEVYNAKYFKKFNDEELTFNDKSLGKESCMDLFIMNHLPKEFPSLTNRCYIYLKDENKLYYWFEKRKIPDQIINFDKDSLEKLIRETATYNEPSEIKFQLAAMRSKMLQNIYLITLTVSQFS